MLTTLWQAFLVAGIPLFIAVLSTTVYLHRSATHGALTLHPLALFGFKFGTWITTGIRPWEWVAVHRKHHRHTDEPGDPHSPYLEGFWQIQLGDVFYYVREARNPQTVLEFAADILNARTWIDRHIFSRGGLGLALGITVLFAVFGLKVGLFAAAIHAILYVFVLSSSVNGLCHHQHFTGYQLYAGRHVEKIFNNWLVALVTGGEGFHHNHHFKQQIANFGHRWWEAAVDWGWTAIWLLEKFRLATAVKRLSTQ